MPFNQTRVFGCLRLIASGDYAAYSGGCEGLQVHVFHDPIPVS